MNRLAPPFRDFAAQKIADHHSQIERCARLLSLEQLWFRPNNHSNSIANLLLHLNGNISQWILAGIAGHSVSRDRPAEFASRQNLPHDALLDPLRATITSACSIIADAPDDLLARHLTIQSYRLTGLAAIFHVVEHLAFHAGQIITTTKWLLDTDLSLYDAAGHRLDGRDRAAP